MLSSKILYVDLSEQSFDVKEKPLILFTSGHFIKKWFFDKF